jgi:hypothetical protein
MVAKKRKLPKFECHNCGGDMEVAEFGTTLKAEGEEFPRIDLNVTPKTAVIKVQFSNTRMDEFEMDTKSFKEWIDSIEMMLDGMFESREGKDNG